jgi:hypothetical protein
MSKLNVNSIVDRLDEGPPELTFGAVIPQDAILTANGDVNVTGVSTISTLSASDINATTITATSFVGDGSQLSGLPVTSASKTIGLKRIIGFDEYRS